MPDMKVQFYVKTHEAWDAMLHDVAHARTTIDIEQYIFIADSIGRKFIELFHRKASEGVKIRIICDAVGSYSLYKSLVPDKLREQGVEIKFFNPISPWRITNFTSNFFRTHRKMMVIDGKIGHLGGVGIQEHFAPWRDTHMRIEGPLVEVIAENFERMWHNLKKSFLLTFPPSELFIKKYSLLTNSPRPKHRHIYRALVNGIRFSKKYVYLTSPYFIPDARLFRVMRVAARKGVDVRLLLPEIADHPFVDHARESYFSFALKAGIKIYVYKNLMMHAKAAVIDDEWATAGSFNLDSLSLRYNHEANIGSTDSEFIAQVRDHFLEDLKNCREIKYEEWTKRPFTKKVLEYLTWPFHWIM